ncbi:hypothetical protein C8Q80DRAFT_1275736 [Daedaleopsis nitida]|nr:hypothetical protein C8Q80DRAFT_1275736 [Daedaleopsis nitida]
MAETIRPNLSSIPPELQAQILLVSDGAAIKACEEVCKSLSDAVKTPVIQYKLELEIAGMIDGSLLRPSDDHPTTERLEKLRAYQKAWTDSSMSISPSTCHRDSSNLQTWESSNGGLKKAYSPSASVPFCGMNGVPAGVDCSDSQGARHGSLPLLPDVQSSTATIIQSLPPGVISSYGRIS